MKVQISKKNNFSINKHLIYLMRYYQTVSAFEIEIEF